jgi:hypothetical protein
MEDISNSIKRPNLRIMGIKEGEQVQLKRIHNISNKIIAEYFPNLEKELSIWVQEASKIRNRFEPK